MSEPKPSYPRSTHYSSTDGFLNGFVLGTLMGATAFFLWGTEKGRKTKEQLILLAKKYAGELEVSLKDLEVKKEEIIEKAQSLSQEVHEQYPQAKKEVVQELKELKDSVAEAKRKADEMQQELQQTASRIEKKFFVRQGRSLKK